MKPIKMEKGKLKRGHAEIKDPVFKCDCCGNDKAVTRDYREQYGVYGKYLVCWVCWKLKDRAFFAKRNKRCQKLDRAGQ